MGSNPRNKEINRMCEAFALHWDLMVHDLEDVCEDETGGPCPKDINDTLPFYGAFRKHSLRLEAGLRRAARLRPRRASRSDVPRRASRNGCRLGARRGTTCVK